MGARHVIVMRCYTVQKERFRHKLNTEVTASQSAEA